MRYPILAAVLLVSAACGQPPATDQKPAAATPATPAATSSEAPRTHRAGAVEGWETDTASVGTTFPAFKVTRPDKTEFTQEALRGRWTIVGFVSEPDGGKDEKHYAAAIVSAADQDPDLDVVWGLTTPTASGSGAAPTIDATELAKTLGIDQTPTYLLVGPDLTVEGYRGPLSTTTDDGIKSVIRGIQQIKKQIAAPE